ncbi:type II secretion system protein [Variovorax sp. YR752]|uniref:type II secretion system protein n=1 Tax=Variovorax sp. YR752 TaxID=1884383 RepID=UPI0031380847
MRRGSGVARGERGFTLVWVLAALVLFSLGLSVVGPSWSDRVKREREEELLRIGRLYGDAIASYREASPGAMKQWPMSLGDLVLDTRFAGTKRHLRRLYADPLQPEAPWGLIAAPGGGVMGVFSTSTETPLQRRDLRLGRISLPQTERYDQWKFVVPAQP